jgi:hypothetical protein
LVNPTFASRSTSETLVPSGFLGLPTGRFAGALTALTAFFAGALTALTASPAFFFGGIFVLFAYTYKRKKNGLKSLFRTFQRFRRGRAPPVAFISAASPIRPPDIKRGRNPPVFLFDFRFGGIFFRGCSFFFLLPLVHKIFFQGGLYLWMTT